MILLGTGTSVGVPVIGCSCEVCTSPNAKNRRTRSSVILGLPEGNLLIDTSPELRSQLVREGIGIAHSVLFTHEHADHLHGMDDIRLFPFHIGGPIPVYASEHVQSRIQHVFDYAFSNRPHTHDGAAPQIELRTVKGYQPLSILGESILPIPLKHGPYCDVLGYRFGNVAYCTDTNFIGQESKQALANLDTLVIDALRYTSHPTHFSIEEALEIIEELKPKQAYLTHLSHDVDYDNLTVQLPSNVALGYDGLRIPLT